MDDQTQARLSNWLDGHVTGYEGPFAVEKFATGQSNPTYLLRAVSGNYVLRRKPEGVLLKSAHAVDREFRVQSALASSDVPVARMRALCEDDTVIGSMFYVMDHVAGRVIVDPVMPDETDRGAIIDEMLSVLVHIHAVDVTDVGLDDFGAPGDYYSRQLGRWHKQYRASETETLAQMDRLIEWLEANMPTDDGQRCLVHGDYRIDNLLFDGTTCKAVLDWELSTLGHPYADLAGVVMQWQLPPGDLGRGLRGVDRARLGLPTDDQFIDSYFALRGRNRPSDFGFYIAFAFFRMGAILQGVKKRALEGNAANPEKGLQLGGFVPEFARLGLEAAHG